MLESLTVKNYAIIDSMTVEFSGGFNVITGETGAGKSIVVDALELILGARFSSEMIRSGSEDMSVCGLFNIDSGSLPDDMSFETDDGVLIIRREIRKDGTGRCFINDNPVTLKKLKELGNQLVDLHGQHDHQSLLNASEHVKYLDSYGALSRLAQETEDLYCEIVEKRTEIHELQIKIENLVRDRELYKFQVREIEEAQLAPGEDTALENDIKRLSSAAELKSLGWEIFQELSENEGSIGERIGQLSSKVDYLSKYDSALDSFVEKIEEISVGLFDLANTFREYAEKIEDDSAALAEMEERLVLVEKIKKKYGPSLEDVFKYLGEIKKEIHGIEEYEEKIAGLKLREKEMELKLTECASLLSEKEKRLHPVLKRKWRLIFPNSV